MSESDDRYQRVNLRFLRELHERLQAAADRNGRSMNAEVIARLEASFNPIEERLLALETWQEDAAHSLSLQHSDIERLQEIANYLAGRIGR